MFLDMYVTAIGETAGSGHCFTVGRLRIDRAVVQSFLTAIQPAGIEAAIQLAACAKVEGDEKRQALELALERARYEEKRSRRQFDAVEPENRLVASELEARWNSALANVAEAEARLASEKTAEPLSEEQKHRLIMLSEDLAALWNQPQAPIELKKRILRTVLTDIIVCDQTTPLFIAYIFTGLAESIRKYEWNETGRTSWSKRRSAQ